MNHRMSGEIVEIYVREGSTMAKVLVDGSYFHVPLFLLLTARVGDHVIVDAGIAVASGGRHASARLPVEA